MAGSPPRAALVTLGCPMNQVDSERIMSGLVSRGFEIVPDEKAEIIVVNTCGFIGSAREESIETILSLAELKRSGSLKSLVVAGCLAERYRNELELELTEADAIAGLAERDRIPDLCLELIGRARTSGSAYTRVVTGPLHTAYLKIAEGCDNRCTYCTIPSIRGPYRSIPWDDIIRDAEELVTTGARELVLIGQDTTRYGSDLGGKTLAGLIRRLSEIEGVSWLRLLYTHPRHMTDELIDTVNEIPQVVPYIDMPVQHIADPILSRMGRHTTSKQIHTLIDTIRSRIGGVVLRTSLIVGFPGESVSDFDKLIDFIRDVCFERLGVFAYSPEEGTPAASMDRQVPAGEAASRCEALMEVQAGIACEFHTSLIGREFDIIIDEHNTAAGKVIGRSYMDAPEIDGNITAYGSVEEGEAFCRVRITAAETYDLRGVVVK